MQSVLIGVILVLALAGLLVAVLIWRQLRQTGGQNLDQVLRAELRQSREEASQQARELRAEVAAAQAQANEVLVKTVNTLGENQKGLLGELTRAVQALAQANRQELEGQREKIQAQLSEAQKANTERFDQVRRAVDEKLRQVLEEQQKHLRDVVAALTELKKANADEFQKARESLDAKFQQIQASNEKKLEEMRQTVDEKLHSTLEKRLGESFKLVSERLEAVQRGLGEMQNLASGVGDLKRVLTNVKERGTWGEYQLGAILEQILTPDQFGRNVRVQEGRETVEFAVKLPGRAADQEQPVWLPIDAKFPKEDYERLRAAAEAADKDGVERATDALLKQVAGMAKTIHDKYIAPPHTTDFGILFLPTEGLYAEVLRQPGFQDEIQRKYRVLVAGPTTLSAILSSLRVGFQTLAIEKRAHEVWTILGAIKTEFGKFGEVLDKVKKQLNTAAKTIDEAGVRTRAMQRQLRQVEQLPADQARAVLELPAAPTPPQGDEPPAAASEDQP
jgi:DNA recombination protein RmuC